MRNSGWYIAYWRKPKQKGKADRPRTEEIVRSDEQLEAVRRRWIERYRRTVHALMLLGLSVGSSRSEVQARYEALCAAGSIPMRDLEDAYRHLMRLLPALERGKRRSAPSTTGASSRGDPAQGEGAETPEEVDARDDSVDEADDDLAEKAMGDAAVDRAALERDAPGLAHAPGGPDSLQCAAGDGPDGPSSTTAS